MMHAEQKKKIEALKRITKRMNSEERQAFEMMLKRHKDDEDLDVLTQRRLDQIHEKYLHKRTKQEIEGAWKKLTGER